MKGPDVDVDPSRRTLGCPGRLTGSPLWQAVFGLLIIGYGVVLLLENLGYRFGMVQRAYFPFAILVLASLVLLQATSTAGRAVGGIVVVGAGAWTYARAVGTPVDVDFWWPIALMAIGVILLLRSKETENVADSALSGRRASPASGTPPSHFAFAFWSGVRRRITSAAFSRADFVAVMGGIEIDLRAASTAGGHAVIEVFALMGGIEITVPPDWAVENRAIVVMGGVADRSTGGQAATNTLVIQGVVAMGGIEIKT